MNNSQEWNIPLPSSQDFLYKITSTPSHRVLPPTPSASSLQSQLSNSWSGKGSQQFPQSFLQSHNLQQFPQSFSQGSLTPQLNHAMAKETDFSKEIRFALHSVLMVIRDLPDKLKDIIITLSKQKDINDKNFIEEVKCLIEAQRILLEQILKVNEGSIKVIEENEKLKHNLLIEIQNKLDSIEGNISSFKDEYLSSNITLKKKLTFVKKACVCEIRKFDQLISDLKRSNENPNYTELEMKIISLIHDMEEKLLKKAETYFYNVFDKESQNINSAKLNIVSDELRALKSDWDNLPNIITQAVKKGLEEFSENSQQKQNFRISEPLIINKPVQLERKITRASPIARVTPQVQQSMTNADKFPAFLKFTNGSNIRGSSDYHQKSFHAMNILDFDNDSYFGLNKKKKIDETYDQSFSDGEFIDETWKHTPEIKIGVNTDNLVLEENMIKRSGVLMSEIVKPFPGTSVYFNRPLSKSNIK